MVNDDSGVEVNDIIEALSRYGVCREELWPYDTSKFQEMPPRRAFDSSIRIQSDNFVSLHSLDDIRSSIAREMPVVLDIDFAPSAFGHEPLETGQIGKPPNKEVEYCDHTVVLVGFNDEKEELTFQNSWGIEWGDKGMYLSIYLSIFYLYFNENV
jgi:hypothetical protein